MGNSEEKNDSKHKILVGKVLEGAAIEQITRFGSAVKEHIVAYTGADQEHGLHLKKSLNSVAVSKVNPEYVDTNDSQYQFARNAIPQIY